MERYEARKPPVIELKKVTQDSMKNDESSEGRDVIDLEDQLSLRQQESHVSSSIEFRALGSRKALHMNSEQIKHESSRPSLT